MVSNSSHQSADSNQSSTRSASPPYSHLAPTNLHPHPPPPIDHTHPYQSGSAYFSQAPMTGTVPYQHDPHRMRATIETDLERPNQFRSINSQVESAHYIPATLPRPRKGTNPSPPTHPKPARNSGSHVQSFPSQPPPPAHPPPPQADDNDDENMSAFAQALRKKQLKRTGTVSDRSAPKVH